MLQNTRETIPILHRIAVIGDVHGEDASLSAVLAYLEKRGPFDALLCTGDLPGKMGVGDTAACCRLLRDAGVQTIRGNHDRWAVLMDKDRLLGSLPDEHPLPSETMQFLKALPKTRELETSFGSLLLCHGVGTNDMDC